MEKLAKERPHIRDLFDRDKERATRFVLENDFFILDYGKTHLTDELLEAAEALHAQLHVEQRIEALFKGEKVNITENRPALHTALRLPEGNSLTVEGRDIMPEIYEVRRRMKALSGHFHNRRLTGSTGKPLRYVVNIGIGGSFLGPMTAIHALAPYQKAPVAFMANVDNEHVKKVFEAFPPEETLYIVVSKSFSTPETLMNAGIVKDRLSEMYGLESIRKHFWAVTANPAKAAGFGIAEENIFPMWDFVGGRYSLWSAVGLAVALGLGYDRFEEMLRGAYRA
ncbi:MAG: glucose-6-phosphate isomerase, partial [Chlorobi bacterium]|nr:glucose-6-phosphate isomerase [Chlorobiota bacterium]